MAKNRRFDASNRSKLAEGVLNAPVDFVTAKTPEKSALRPSSYVLFKANKGKHSSKSSNSSDTLPSSPQKPLRSDTPKTLASAVLKYTGKKYGSKIEKRKKSQPPSASKDVTTDKKEKLKMLLLESNGVSLPDDQQLSQDEFKDDDEFVDAKESFDPSPPATVDEDGDEDEDEEDDVDFDDDKESASESSSEPSSASSDDEEIDNPVQLKRDLKEELKESHLKAPIQSKETPPTSPDDDTVIQGKLIETKFTKSQFYDLNESPSNRGSNGSKRIEKSWNGFAQGHTPLGLLNHGVTCYMNSAIQSLCHIPSLCHYLNGIQSGEFKNTIKEDSVSAVLASTICKMYRVGHERKLMHINPKKLINRLEDINCMMSEWQQEDSHEYLMSLMSRLQEDSTPKGVKLNQSIIYDIFGGLLDQSVTCKNCGHISTTQQEFYDLSLTLDNRKKTSLMIEPQELFKLRNQIENCKSSNAESKVQLSDLLKQKILVAQEERRSQTPEPKAIESSSGENDTEGAASSSSSSSKTYTIENSIKDFFTPEVLKSGYICELCKQSTNAIKISTISRSPETLSIHLKRFRFNGQQSQKVKANVTYPEYLDLTEFTTSMNEPTMYKLTSVIVHQGRSVSSGHYIAHCRQIDGTWSTYDDEYVNKIRPTVALSDPGAYVLIYERLTHKRTEGGNERKRRKRN